MASVRDQINTLIERVKDADLPQELSDKLSSRLDQLSGLVESPTFLPEFDRMNKYVGWILSLPWKKSVGQKSFWTGRNKGSCFGIYFGDELEAI